jgi:YD repeat-containing protein
MSDLFHFTRICTHLSFATLLTVLLIMCGISETRAANGSVAYTYDALGRVATVSYDTGVCIIYSYDANGNRTQQTINVGSASSAVWGTGVWGCFTWTP